MAHPSLRNNNFRIVETLGEFNPARGILLAIYTTILAASIYLLIYPDTKFAIALLLVQIDANLNTNKKPEPYDSGFLVAGTGLEPMAFGL